MNPLHYIDIYRVLCFDDFVVSARNYECMPKIERFFGRVYNFTEEKLSGVEELRSALKLPKRK